MKAIDSFKGSCKKYISHSQSVSIGWRHYSVGRIDSIQERQFWKVVYPSDVPYLGASYQSVHSVRGGDWIKGPWDDIFPIIESRSPGVSNHSVRGSDSIKDRHGKAAARQGKTESITNVNVIITLITRDNDWQWEILWVTIFPIFSCV